MSTTTVVRGSETATMSHRKQPVRQTRVNPARNVSGARALGGGGSGAVAPLRRESPPGFFPGITHFTDAITALPRDMVRHFTMLKEVDAKIGRPEDALQRVVGDVLSRPVPRARNGDDFAIGQVVSGANPQLAYSTAALAPPDGLAGGQPPHDAERRQQGAQIVMLLRNMLVTMDEKTHVLTTANEELERHLARCESSWPQIEREISETTRVGNPNHRALDNEVAPEKKPSAVGERPRREAAMSSAHAAALAGEGGSRKHRGAQHDSDFDEPPRGKGKAAAKGKRSEPPTSGGVGLGIANGSASNKRRKVEKGSTAAVGSQAMDRSNTSTHGASRNGGASPAQPSTEVVKKRARGSAMAAAVGGRKRAGTQNSASNSPAMASSPVMGNFAVSQRGGGGGLSLGVGGGSPALGAAMQRSSSTRARANSAAQTSQPRVAATSAPKETNGIVPVAIAAPEPPGKNGDHKAVKAEEGAAPDGPPRSSGRATDRGASKTEDRHRPPSISTGTRNNGRASKTSTPVAASFPDSAGSVPRPRSGRSMPGGGSGGDSGGGQSAPAKRSHKKGAGLAAQQQKAAIEAAVAKAAAAAAVADESSVLDGDDDDDPENEPRYCYCGGVSYGEMVACDWKSCQREWFHLDCAGLSKAPGKEKWYCRDCAPKVPKVR